MIEIIICICSLFLDGILTNFFPYLPNQLSLFTPLLTVSSIFIIYPFFQKKEKNYYKLLIILGIVYDLLYTNLLFLNAIIFCIIGLLAKIIYKNFEVSHIRITIYTIIIITCYESIIALLLYIFRLVPITIPKVLYKITHSLLLNIVYVNILYKLTKNIKNKNIN